MISLAGLVIGFALGWRRAAQRGGATGDKWQYAIGHAVAFGLLAFLLSLIALRLGLLPPLIGG